MTVKLSAAPEEEKYVRCVTAIRKLQNKQQKPHFPEDRIVMKIQPALITKYVNTGTIRSGKDGDFTFSCILAEARCLVSLPYYT